MKNTNFKFEWRNILLISVSSLVIVNLVNYLILQFMRFLNLNNINYWLLFPVIIFLITPLVIGSLISKKVKSKKFIQAGLSSIFYLVATGIEILILAFLSLQKAPLEILNSLDISVFIISYVLFVIPISLGLSCLGVFIYTKKMNTKNQ